MVQRDYESMTEKQQRIIDELRDDPTLTDREIAEETDTSSQYVNSVRNDYREVWDDGYDGESDEMDISNLEDEDLAAEYEKRTEKQKAIIDYKAENPDASWKEAAKHANASGSYASSYVAGEYEHLIQHRRAMMGHPVESEAVSAAISEEDDAAMRERAKEDMEDQDPLQAIADGSGDGELVSIDLQLKEVFRCIRLLPNDLAAQFFMQVRTGQEGLDNLFPEEEE